MERIALMQRFARKLFDGGFSTLIVLLVLAYPIFAYIGVKSLSPAQFALAIMAMFSLRFVVIKEARQASQWPILLGVFTFCFFVIVFDSEKLLKYYPAMMNTGFGLLFLYSLKGDSSLIEQFLNASGKIPPPHARGYLRGLSRAWGLFLLANALISAYTSCCTSAFIWALYNGMLSYIAIATFVLGEMIFRIFYKRNYAKKNLGIAND